MAERIEKGFSAGQMRKLANQRREPTTKVEPVRYTVKKAGQIVAENLSLKDVQKMFPNVKGNTIKKRLESGEREIDRLARPPDPKNRFKARRVIP